MLTISLFAHLCTRLSNGQTRENMYHQTNSTVDMSSFGNTGGF